MPSISEEEYMKQQKVVAKELEKLLKTPYFLKKMRYLDFIKEMKQVMEKCRKNITVTNEELDIARKNSHGRNLWLGKFLYQNG